MGAQHEWVESEGTALTSGQSFRFCERCDLEEWEDGTIRPGWISTAECFERKAMDSERYKVRQCICGQWNVLPPFGVGEHCGTWSEAMDMANKLAAEAVRESRRLTW